MMQQYFINKALEVVQKDSSVIGLTVGGSWLTNEIDEYSDLDLTLVIKEKVSGDPVKMLSYASSFGKLLSGFTGEHVGEPRLLICLYDDPLLHVDIKFITLDEFKSRVENPVILYDTNDQLKNILSTTGAVYPFPDYQWIEDRFWVWIHYTAAKIGRGELLEALDSLGFLRIVVLGPLLQIKNSNLPRGVRKAEMSLPADDLIALKRTIAEYERGSVIAALEACVQLYQDLREKLVSKEMNWRTQAEIKSLEYLRYVKEKN